jgi:hypothetical protein
MSLGPDRAARPSARLAKLRRSRKALKKVETGCSVAEATW